MEIKEVVYKGAIIKVSTKGGFKKNPVIFLHGNSLSSSTFKKQFEELDLPLVAIDLPGHGNSEPAKDSDGNYSIQGYAQAVASVIRQLKVENFILAGHSLGGHVAINVAAELKNTSGLLIFGTPPLDSVNSLGQAFLPNPLFPLLLQGTVSNEEAMQLAESMLFQKEHKNILKNDILGTDPSARSCFGAFVAKGIIEDEVKIIKKRNYPVAILHGENDSFVNREYIEGIGFSNLWKNKIHQITNSDHCPQLEQAATFNALLNDYYNSVFP